jgi:hypothetical protein
MQACLLAEGPVESAIDSPAAQKEFPAGRAPGLIRPSRTLEPLERLDIYRGMYELRLLEALRVDYPGLAAYLGEAAFNELGRLYVSSCPSRSYTLNRFGDRLPEFIQHVAGVPRPRFAEALAHLELAETFVFDEAESPAAKIESVADLGEEQWARLRLTPIRALRLLTLGYPAHEFMQAIRGNEVPPSFRRRQTHLIVYRRDYRLFHLAVSAPAFALFQSLAERATLGEAMDCMFRAGGGSSEQVFAWFRHWFTERLFRSVELH